MSATPHVCYTAARSRRDRGRVDRRLSKLLQHGVDLLEGRVDLLAQLAARQHHLGTGWRVGWVSVGWRLAGGWLITRPAGPIGGPDRRAQQAGPAGGARRAGPCSDRPCALPETKISSTILGCTWLGLGLGV